MLFLHISIRTYLPCKVDKITDNSSFKSRWVEAGKLEKKVGKLLRTSQTLYISYLNSLLYYLGSSILSVVEEKSFSDSRWALML